MTIPGHCRDVNLEVVSRSQWFRSGWNGAQPGTSWLVDILDVGALQGDEWGFTGIFAKENGGFLTDSLPQGSKAIGNF